MFMAQRVSQNVLIVATAIAGYMQSFEKICPDLRSATTNHRATIA